MYRYHVNDPVYTVQLRHFLRALLYNAVIINLLLIGWGREGTLKRNRMEGGRILTHKDL